MRSRNTYRIALGGLVAALSVVLFFLTGMIPYAAMALPAVAGALLIAVTAELGSGWALLIFAAVSILSALLAPDKDAVVFYIAFFGYYPILKRNIEAIRVKWAQWAVKFALFSVSMLAVYAVSATLLGLPDQFQNAWYLVLVAVVFEAVFLIYDIALSRFVVVYFDKLRKLFKL